MSDDAEMILPETATKDLLKSLLEAAYLDVSLDDDGDVQVMDTFRFWVIPSTNGKWIRLFAQFKGNPAAALGAKLEYVNAVNRDLHLIRAYLRDNGGYTFDQYVVVEGGISRRALVFAVRGFRELLQSALKLDSGDVVG
jgi:hypothetical protein